MKRRKNSSFFNEFLIWKEKVIEVAKNNVKSSKKLDFFIVY